MPMDQITSPACAGVALTDSAQALAAKADNANNRVKADVRLHGVFQYKAFMGGSWLQGRCCPVGALQKKPLPSVPHARSKSLQNVT
jgi:hypothetical protein